MKTSYVFHLNLTLKAISRYAAQAVSDICIFFVMKISSISEVFPSAFDKSKEYGSFWLKFSSEVEEDIFCIEIAKIADHIHFVLKVTS